MDSLAAAEQQSQPGDVVLDAGRDGIPRRPGRRSRRSGPASSARSGWSTRSWTHPFPSRTPPPVAAAARRDRPPVAAPAGLGADGRRSRRVPGRPAPGRPGLRTIRRARLRERPARAAGAGRLRHPGRQAARRAGRLRPPADHRRQGRLSVRRLRRRPSPTRTTPPAPARAPCGCSRSPSEVPVTDVQVGVATGRLRSGTYGHPERRTFCCLGDAVNLAARLMTRAPAGGIWVHGDVADAADERFVWEDLPAIAVKGRQQEVPVRRLLARAARRRAGATGSALQRDGRPRGRAGAAARPLGGGPGWSGPGRRRPGRGRHRQVPARRRPGRRARRRRRPVRQW